MEDVLIEDISKYVAEDSFYTLKLNDCYWERLSEPDRRLYNTVDLPLVMPLVRMEVQGAPVDMDAVKALSEPMAEEIELIRKRIFGAVGRELNLNATADLRQLLFDDLRLKSRKRTTKTKQLSTDKDVIENLRDGITEGTVRPFNDKVFTVLEDLLTYKSLFKLESTYSDNLKPHPITGVVHTEFKQTSTITGRLSSGTGKGGLNFQNIPIRTEIGREMRRVFIAPPGWLFMKADASQEELRILAHFSQDPKLMSAYTNDEDVHGQTASRVFFERLCENLGMSAMRLGLPKNRTGTEILSSLLSGTDKKQKVQPETCLQDWEDKRAGGRFWQLLQEQEQAVGYRHFSESTKAAVRTLCGYEVSTGTSPGQEQIQQHLGKSGNLMQILSPERARGLFELLPIWKTVRDLAKIVGFGVIYGFTPRGLAAELGCDVPEAQRIIEELYRLYPGLYKYEEMVEQQLKTFGYVTTVLGRKMAIPNYFSSSVRERSKAIELGRNYKCQGSGADIIRLATARVDKFILENSLESRIHIQVHDELDILVKPNEIHLLVPVVSRELAPKILRVPMKTEIEVGINWVDLQPYDPEKDYVEEERRLRTA